MIIHPVLHVEYTISLHTLSYDIFQHESLALSIFFKLANAALISVWNKLNHLNISDSYERLLQEKYSHEMKQLGSLQRTFWIKMELIQNHSTDIYGKQLAETLTLTEPSIYARGNNARRRKMENCRFDLTILQLNVCNGNLKVIWTKVHLFDQRLSKIRGIDLWFYLGVLF